MYPVVPDIKFQQPARATHMKRRLRRRSRYPSMPNTGRNSRTIPKNMRGSNTPFAFGRPMNITNVYSRIPFPKMPLGRKINMIRSRKKVMAIDIPAVR